MDFIEASKELITLADEQIRIARIYYAAKIRAARAKLRLYLILTGEKLLSKYMEYNKNIGVEKALLRMIEEKGEEVKKEYKIFEEQTARYEGASKLFDAYTNKIIAIESLMKYQLKGEQ